MKKFRNILAVVFLAVCGVFASLAFSGCGYCQHKLDEVIPAVPSTCMEQGYKKAYKCSKCKQLFGFDTVKNALYEIDEQELADFAGHTVSGELEIKVDEHAESFDDFHVDDTCRVCGKTFTIDRENLFHVAASNYNNVCQNFLEVTGEKGKEDYTYYSQFTLNENMTPSETTPVLKFQAGDNRDKRVNVDIPYTNGEDRYCLAIFRNNGDVDVDVMYGGENGAELGITEKLTIPAGGYAAAPFTLNFSVTASRCWTRLYLLSELDREVKLDMVSYYYEANTKLASTAFSQTGTDYLEGEKINPETMIFKETYEGGGVRVKTGLNATSDMFGRALTVEDNLVELKYGGKKYNYYISVASTKRTLTIIGAEFKDGSHSRRIPFDADQPNDIVFKPNAMFLYWTDMYGEKLPYGFNMDGQDRIIRAVYAGEGQTDFDAPVDYGTNYALNKECDSSSIYAPNGDPLTSNWRLAWINDGRKNGAAQTDSSSEKDDWAWFKIDLGEVITINEVHLYAREDGVYFPTGYYIEVSEDGETWKTVFTNEHDIHSTDKAYNSSFKNKRICFFEDIDARYVRISTTDLTSAGGGYYFALSEMEVYHV